MPDIFALVPKQLAVQWNYTPIWILNSNPGYMDAVDFDLVLQQHMHQYRLVVDGKNLGTNFGVGMGSTGESVAFSAFSGKGISVSSTIMVYVVSPVSKNEYLVAKWPVTAA
ncbi:immunomodulatory protein [Epithele typhae]|uniref:immunomodulatory protein n=1 Tax=Epithele typhae TaxID=378194 RepID=UPI002008C0F5|nr:immunomodulatory protein [Epithele typhae]KAH9936786.1 immunomodulatory protein [Epithele typhae]